MTERKVSSESVSEDFVEQVAKEIAKHTYARCLPQMSDCEDWDAMEEADRKIYRAAAEAVLAPLSQASSVIAGLKEANEALMRERTSLIETKREQIEQLTAERDDLRDEWQAEYDARLAANAARRAAEARTSSVIAGLKAENERTNLGWEQTSIQLGSSLSRISSLEEENKRMREANEALMRERTSMIATHRESINRLTLKIGALEAKAEHAARQALEDHNG